MKVPDELSRIKISQPAKDSLIVLKRRTGIENWNVLCRWALCLSLSVPKVPAAISVTEYSNIEMGWKTFAGEHELLYLHLLKERCLHDGLLTDSDTLAEYFTLHLHRGIAYLSTKGKIADIKDLVNLVHPHNT